MAEKSNILTAKFVVSGRIEAGSYADGKNLYLRVGKSGSKSWVFRWHDRHAGKVRELGLGSFNSLSLADARDKAGELRGGLANGATAEDLRAMVKPRVETDMPTFKAYAEKVIAAKKASPKYKSKKHLDQWTATLSAYAYTHAAKLNRAVDEIGRGFASGWQDAKAGAKSEKARVEADLQAKAGLKVNPDYRSAVVGVFSGLKPSERSAAIDAATRCLPSRHPGRCGPLRRNGRDRLSCREGCGHADAGGAARGTTGPRLCVGSLTHPDSALQRP